MPKHQAVNITCIAREAGLSIASVSRAMNGRNGVSEEVRKRVNELLKKHNYVACNHLIREKRIAIFQSSDCFGGYLTELYHGFTETAEEFGIDFCSVIHSASGKRTLLEEIRELQCSGVIVLLPFQFQNEFPALANSELKVMLVDSYPTGEEGKFGFVNHDAYSGSLAAVKHLIELGHRNIGYVRHPLRTANHQERFQAWQDGLAEIGIVPPPSWVIEPGDACTEVRRKTVSLLERHPELTALMVTSDEEIPGVFRAAWETGRKIPDDLSVVGFDDLPQCSCFVPALTTVHHPIREIASLAIRELSLCLKDSDRPLPKSIFPCPLIVRESTGRPSVTTAQIYTP